VASTLIEGMERKKTVGDSEIELANATLGERARYLGASGKLRCPMGGA
jgi:hypothetical protein